MNREFTNSIRYLMDEWIPAAIRDSRWFMWPFFWLAFRGQNIHEIMNFKSNVWNYSPEEYDQFYNSINTISRNRLTDLNQASMQFILSQIDPKAESLLDVGCGLGYLLCRVNEGHPDIQLTGLDIRNPESPVPQFAYVKGRVEKLPFEKKSFDIVTCCHTLEHMVDLDESIAELFRVARKQVFIVVPRQRYFYYTLDEHVNFFPHAHLLTHKFSNLNAKCLDLGGDWGCLISLNT